MQLNMKDNSIRSYSDLSKQIDESLEAISLDEMDDYMDESTDWNDDVVESPSTAELIPPVVKEEKKDITKDVDSSQKESSFKTRLSQLKKANADLIEKTKKELEDQIIEFDASNYVLPKDTKSFVIRTLKKEGLEISESSKGFEVNLDF